MTDTSSPEYRMQCEARHVLTMPLAARRKYLDLVEKHRQKQGRWDLEEAIRVEWKSCKKAA